MKKVVAVILSALLLLSLAACAKETPVEKVGKFITQNGVQDGEQYVLECADAGKLLEENEDTIAGMSVKGEKDYGFRMRNGENGITLEIYDEVNMAGGVKMEVTIQINPDGTFAYSKGVSMEGVNLGVTLKGEIDMATYAKGVQPVITESKFSAGAKMNDAVMDGLKEYINLALDCYSVALAQDGLGLTLADVGFAAYV